MDAPVALPFHVRMDAAVEQAQRSLGAVAATSRRDAGASSDVLAALVSAEEELARIRATAASVPWLSPCARRFLVVDDSADVRLIVARIIRRAAPDAAIATARDGADALAALRHAGDGTGVVVISDHDMGPGRNGMQLLAEVAALHPKARRVLLTGHARDRLPMEPSEPDAILPKETGFASLRALLRTL